MTMRVFVTGSGTDVGKTFVMQQMIGALRRARRSVRALKPVASGFDPARPADGDPGLLLAACGLPPSSENLDAVTPWRFRAPLSPDMAAAREGRAIPFDEVVTFCRGPAREDLTLIEGIGGVMVPLDARHTVLDLIAAVGAPVVLVAGSYLGTLSHTLTAAAALESRGCPLLATIVSESPDQPVAAEETASVLRRFLGATTVHVLPRLADDARAPLDWLAILGAPMTRR